MTVTFSELGIPLQIAQALEKKSILHPTPIQEVALPALRENINAYLQAETGTGKTLAYLLPVFAKLDPSLPHGQCIIVAPTHELAIQIHRECTDLAQLSGIPIRSILLIGGTSRDRQLEKLKKKPHIFVGSPGRICELIAQGKVKTREVRTLVIDEADRLIGTEGFEDIKAILESLPKTRSLIFVSATEHRDCVDAVESLAPGIQRIQAGSAKVNPNIEHLFLRCEERDKPEIARKLIHALSPERAMVFVHKNETAELVASKFAHHHMRVADIHGARDKEERKKAMEDFRSGKTQVLLASDVAARGLDIKGVTHVINLDVPSESSDYLHRVGRTGRAGLSGIALSLVSEPQSRLIARFRKDLGIVLTEVYLRGGLLTPVGLPG